MKTKANIGRLDVPQKVLFGERIVTAMQNNPAFASLQSMVSELESETDTLDSTYQDTKAARQLCSEKMALQEAATETWDTKVNLLAAAVEQVSAGDSAVILSSGFEVRNPSAPIGPLPAPENLAAATNGHDGQVKLRWRRVRGADTYEVQSASDPMQPNSWTTKTTSTGARVVLNGLPSVTRQWFRVRAIGAAGPSGWSEPAVKTVP